MKTAIIIIAAPVVAAFAIAAILSAHSRAMNKATGDIYDNLQREFEALERDELI